MIVIVFVLVLPRWLRVLPLSIFQWKSVKLLKAPTAPCMDGGRPKVLPSFTDMPQHAPFKHPIKQNLLCVTLSLICVFFRHRPRWGTEQCNHAYGQQRHVLTNQRERWGEQNMCWRQKRRRRMWCKGENRHHVKAMNRRINKYCGNI